MSSKLNNSHTSSVGKYEDEECVNSTSQISKSYIGTVSRGFNTKGSGGNSNTSQHSLVSNETMSSSKSFESYYRDIFTKLPYNTQRAYISDYNEFAIFCKQTGLSGFSNSFEHNETCIKRYVEELCRSPLAYRTIKRRLSALSKFLGVAKLPNPIIRSAYLRDFIRLSLIENKKFRLSHKQAVPLTIDMVEQINNAIIPD